MSTRVESLIKEEWDKTRLPVLEALNKQNKDYVLVSDEGEKKEKAKVDPFWVEWAEVTKKVKNKLDILNADVTLTCVDRAVMDAIERRMNKLKEMEELN